MSDELAANPSEGKVEATGDTISFPATAMRAIDSIESTY